MNFGKILGYTIEYSFYILFFFVPIFWLPVTSELFEFNKMILVYLLTVVIVVSWLLKALFEKKLIIKKTPLDLPLGLFLLANLFSTIFSIDPLTSLFGYFGRFHGGLLSTFSYIILYYAFVNNVDKNKIYSFLFTLLLSSTAIALYGVLQHPNPLFQEKLGSNTIFHGIDYDYWSVDVENRVFSTLGQPNWLAGFLAMTIFPLLGLLFINKILWQKVLLFLALTLSYFAFTFTYSRGGLIGLVAGGITFLGFLFIYKKPWWEKLLGKFDLKKLPNLKTNKIHLLSLISILLLIISTNSFFGNAISQRGGLQTKTDQLPKEQPNLDTQLDVGGQQTAQIRTIVWQGAVEIFKHYPIFGSGVETFGYSYYLFRPVSHNYTAEWDYLYNKAHNEYLNYLSTTGSVGFLAYLFLIGSFEFLAVKTLIKAKWSAERLLGLGILAGYNSYLVQNFFGFSVVAIAVLFFLYPVFFFVVTDSLGKNKTDLFNLKRLKFLKEKIFNLSAKILLVFIGVLLFVSVVSMWVSDVLYSNSFGNKSYNQAISNLQTAIALAPYQPAYRAELATNYSGLANVLFEEEEDQERIKEFSEKAKETINEAVATSPNNTALWKTKRIVDFNLSKINEAYYLELRRTASALDQLAPTDASTLYDVALVYLFIEDNQLAERQLEKVVSLKNDYQEAVVMLARTYAKNEKYEEAINLLRDWVSKHPDDQEATELLKTLFTS